MEWHQGTVLGKHGAELRGLHRAPLYEFRDLPAVDLRPLAPGPARREPLQVVVLVELAHLAVDPAVAEGGLDGLIVGDGLQTRALLGEFEPQPVRGRVVLFEPSLPRVAGGERDYGLFGLLLGGHGISFSSQPRWC
jgi:hypothetical protein